MFNPAKREMVHEIYETLLEYRKKFRFNMSVGLLRDGDRIDSRYTHEDFAWREKTVKEFADVVDSVADKFPLQKQPGHALRLFYDIENDGKREISHEKNHDLKLTNGMLAFKGMFCISHTSVLRIEETGECHGMVCYADGITCNIYEKDSLFKNRDNLIRAVQCPCNICGCRVNDPIPKFASEEEAKKFVEIMQARQNRLLSGETN